MPDTHTAEAVTYPIFDPRTGEVLAATEADRAEVVALLAEALVNARRIIGAHYAVVDEVQRKLAALMRRGEAHALPDGWAVAVAPAPRPKRTVLTWAVEEHQEALQPLGLGYTETPVMQRSYPTVADLTSAAARRKLAQAGLTPEQLLHQAAPAPDRVVVIEPEPPEEDR